MSKPELITIVVVTYHNDFFLLERLLKSIYENWDPSQVESICVILNDRFKYLKEFDKLIENNSNENFKIKKILAQELEPAVEAFDWHSQQLFKCLSSSIVNTDWYVINDCKDYYTKKVDISQMFDNTGRATIQIDHTRYPSDNKVPAAPGIAWAPGPFSIALKTSYEIFGLDFNDHKVMHFPTTTPFIVKTDIMKGMVSELKSMTRRFFPFLFSLSIDGQCVVTEFLLYSAYCYATTKNKDYVDWNVNHREFYIGVKQSKDLRLPDGPTNTAFCDV